LLSAFNPSTMSPKLLEAIFVEREPLVQELLGSIRGSLSPTSKAHSLILGPRGMGKTHLVSLIYHRIREGKKGAEGLDEHLRIAWLREEERGIATFFHLLRRIIVVLAATYKDPELEKRLTDLKGNSPQDTQVLAERLLVEWLDGKTLLLLVENFEDMLHRMGEQGQQAFRAFLQNRSCSLVLATAPTLTAALSKQTAPFYNFFNLHTLKEFSVETARGLMRLIAQQRGDKEFADFLETPVATERLRAIEDLAGGHPRIWILFAGFLTKEILDDLVPAFYKLVDELTPYYQSKMENLPGQEALIIETLCEKPGAMPVKELADACFLAPNAVSAHLNDLTKRGFVRSEKLGRESYYELREPLLRIWIQVKGDRDKPIQLLIEFIKRWFTIEQSEEILETLPEGATVSKNYFRYAISSVKISIDIANEIDRNIDILIGNGNYKKALELGYKVLELKGANASGQDFFSIAFLQSENHDYRESLKYFDIAISINPNNMMFLVGKINVLFKLKNINDAYLLVNKAIDKFPDLIDWKIMKGRALLYMGDLNGALKFYDEAIKMKPDYSEAWGEKARALYVNGYFDESLNCFDKAINFDKEKIKFYIQKSTVFITLDKWRMFIKNLKIAYSLKSDKNKEYGEGGCIHAILLNKKNFFLWEERIPDLLLLAKEFSRLGIWGDEIVDNFSEILKDDVSNQVADTWLAAWQKAGAGYEEMEIPLRMLAAAVEWKKTRSRAALLRLEPELRSKLESLLPPEASVVEAPRRKR
ncbi:tetratricopeptide repeat protein, partial [Armatimonas sp.]|uniref:tetratricopeptide repeat protein n=1 Tax=Armatimonas sp. TaxID=1872638 RepID=UPI003751378A